MKYGRRVAELLGLEVGDRLAAHVGDAHPERERVDERSDDDVAALLGLLCIHVVEVQRVMVHRDQAEEMVVGLGDRLRRPVLVDGPHLELLEVAAIRMRAARLAGCLIGLEFVHGGTECQVCACRPGSDRWDLAPIASKEVPTWPPPTGSMQDVTKLPSLTGSVAI